MADGRHPIRFIVEYFYTFYNKWHRSGNYGIDGFFKTRKKATTAMGKYKSTSNGLKYRVRIK